MHQQLKEIARCLKRLERSDTPRKRKTARRAFQQALRALEKEADAAYRPMRDDGSEVILVKRKGVACPYCKVPFRGLTPLLAHLRLKHGWQYKYGLYRCGCGKPFTHPQKLIKHMAAYPDLGVHIASSELKRAATEE